MCYFTEEAKTVRDVIQQFWWQTPLSHLPPKKKTSSVKVKFADMLPDLKRERPATTRKPSAARRLGFHITSPEAAKIIKEKHEILKKKEEKELDKKISITIMLGEKKAQERKKKAAERKKKSNLKKAYKRAPKLRAT